jgi:RND family efflux transporter MFP subunit
VKSNRFCELAAVAILFASCGNEPSPAAAVPRAAGPVAVARSETLVETRITTGTVRSATVSPLAAKVMGNVTRVLVSEGQHVRAGELLAEIDDREMRAKTAQATAGASGVEQAIAAARANAEVMATTYKRFAALRERGSVSPQEFDEITAKNRAAQAQLEQALAQRTQARAGVTEAETFLSYSQVRSPIDGMVTARMIDPGAQAAPGMPLLTVEDDAHYRVETTVDEALAARVHAGDAVAVDGVPARVSSIVPAVDPATRSAIVKIDLPRGAGFRSGSFVRAAFAVGTRSAIMLPAAAVQRRGPLTSVSVVGAGGVARMRLITLGAVQGERIEVLSGLDAGETVAMP